MKLKMKATGKSYIVKEGDEWERKEALTVEMRGKGIEELNNQAFRYVLEKTIEESGFIVERDGDSYDYFFRYNRDEEGKIIGEALIVTAERGNLAVDDYNEQDLRDSIKKFSEIVKKAIEEYKKNMLTYEASFEEELEF